MRKMVLSVIGIIVISLLVGRPSLAQERGIVRQDAAKSVGSSSEGRLALLIGNSAYTHGGSLKNPVNDVRDMKATLEGLGFRVMKHENCTQRSMKKAIDEFGEALRGCEVGLFFYAGHGVQVGGENYLIPVDAELQSEKVVEYDCVRADRVLAMMEGAGSKTNIVILDACRDNPFERSWRRGGSVRGLAVMNAPSGALIAYATAPGRTALDGTGRNGVYTSALLEHIRTSDISVLQMFQRVRVSVEERTSRAQTPWESTSLRGDFYFLVGGAPVARVDAPRPSAAPDPLAEERGKLEKELRKVQAEREAAESRARELEEKRKVEELEQRIAEERKKKEEVAGWLREEEEKARRQKQTVSVPTERQQSPISDYGVEVGRDGVYIAYPNGIVKDTKTGLEWVAGPDRSMNLNEAKAWVESLNVGGGGWRMPTMAELKGLYQYGKGKSNMTPLLKTTGSWVWTGQDAGSFLQYFNFNNAQESYFTTFGPSLSSQQFFRAFAVRSRSSG